MTESFKYSKKRDLPKGLNVKELREEIQVDDIISAQCLAIINNNSEPDRVEIVFDVGLTGGEYRTLTQIVRSHDPLNIPELTQMIVKTIDKKTYERTYELIGKFIFPGAKFCKIMISGKMDPNGGSWSFMLYDYDHHKKITEATFTNTKHIIHDLGLACDIPANDTTFEIFGKIQNGSEDNDIKAYLDSIKIMYA